MEIKDTSLTFFTSYRFLHIRYFLLLRCFLLLLVGMMNCDWSSKMIKCLFTNELSKFLYCVLSLVSSLDSVIHRFLEILSMIPRYIWSERCFHDSFDIEVLWLSILKIWLIFDWLLIILSLYSEYQLPYS